MVDERTTTYLNSLYPEIDARLLEVEKNAIETFVPIIRKETQNLIQMLIKEHKPKRILEVGTAVGFSGSLMLLAAGDNATLTTIENYEPRFALAEGTFEKMELSSRVTFLKGDAMEILPKLVEDGRKFDFVFMDAAKGQYINFWPMIQNLTDSGAMIVTDNCLQDGEIIESRYAVVRRNRTIHKRMREYLYELTHDERYFTSILPLGDGVAVSIKR